MKVGSSRSRAENEMLAEMLTELENRKKYNQINNFFADGGPHPREQYHKHLEFFSDGNQYRERLLMAANRVGKTICGGYESAVHLTGDYPHWWEGRRFDRPISMWAAGITNETTRDVVQFTMMGAFNDIGTGMIPRDKIASSTNKRGVAQAIETVRVNHASGGESVLGFKSYNQGRDTFQGTSKDIIWLDEEAPFDVYNECLIRTATTNGLIYTTFTPLMGLSEMVMSFLPDMQAKVD